MAHEPEANLSFLTEPDQAYEPGWQGSIELLPYSSSQKLLGNEGGDVRKGSFGKLGFPKKPVRETREILPERQSERDSGEDDDWKSSRRLLFFKQSNGARSKARAWAAWSPTVFGGMMLAILVLALNISLLIWANVTGTSTNSGTLVFTGLCTQSTTIMIFAELAINTVSTLLFAASNNCCQLLLAPTRAEIDAAHARGMWLHVGVASLRNFPRAARWRKFLWILLCISSIPLHLVYNSIVYSSSNGNDYFTAVVTEDFINGSSWNVTHAGKTFESSYIPANTSYWDLDTYKNFTLDIMTILESMRANPNNLTTLDNSDCQAAYNAKDKSNQYTNVIVITNATEDNVVIAGALHKAEAGSDPEPWFKPSDVAQAQITEYGYNTSIDCGEYHYSQGANWSFPICDCPKEVNCSTNGGVVKPAYVQSCLAQSVRTDASLNQCTISISNSLLIVVIVCNVVKACCLGITLMASARNFRPLATVGDAVASFMERPDPYTSECGTLSISMVQDIACSDRPIKEIMDMRTARKSDSNCWKGKIRRWGHVLKSGYCIMGLTVCVAGLGSVIIATGSTWKGDLLSSWQQKKSFSADTTTGENSSAGTLLHSIVLINMPQLVVSFVYLFYNSVLTRMAVANEFSKFSRVRRSLRVSRPSGKQRSTYWLQLPYRYVLPLMATMAILHWLISRGIYLQSLTAYDLYGNAEPSRSSFTFATSNMALMLAVCVGLALFVVLFTLMCRTIGVDMPVLGTCSFAISAACHPVKGDEHAATESLQYGVVGGLKGFERRHVAFSSLEVEPLQDKELYH